jgi:phenylacetate-CoA ligase
MAGTADKIYKHLPVFAQHGVITAYGWHWNRLRFGGAFSSEVHAYKSRERFSRQQWEQYSQENLRQLLVLAFTRVPYYQQAWKGLVTQAQLERFTLRDLVNLPPLEKQIARDRPFDLLVDGKPDKQQRVFHTSGSTGTPVKTFWYPAEMQKSLAMREARSCGFANVSYKLPRATFSGRMVEPNPDSKGPFYRFNYIEKQVYFSAFHLSPHNVHQYIHALKKHEIVWITGYSNSIYQLARMALDQGIIAPKIQAVITTSEKVTPEMREIIERAFSTTVYEEYGTVENTFYACENQYGEKLINPDAGILEVVDEQFQSSPIGEQGEVLGTGFIRPNQPLIRYRIGDMAVLSDKKPSCGREMPILEEVVGRLEDTIYGVDGRRMVRFHGIFVNQPNIAEGQIVQDSLTRIRARVVVKPDFNSQDEQEVIARIQQRLTTAMQVTVERVDQIERTKAGKFRAVVSNLSQQEREQVAKL